MWVVFCSTNDIPALWAYEGLKLRGLTPLELVSVDELAYSLRWEHRINDDSVCFDISLADGRRLESNAIDGILNRIVTLPTEHLLLANPRDREYAEQEFYSFFLSWLYALPKPVINEPTPQGLCGRWRHISEWVCLAAKAGLPVTNYRQSSRDPGLGKIGKRMLIPPGSRLETVIAIDGHVIGSKIPSELIDGCLSLTEFTDTALLGIQFVVSQGDSWNFVRATPYPDLTLGGQSLLDVLASALKNRKDRK